LITSRFIRRRLPLGLLATAAAFGAAAPAHAGILVSTATSCAAQPLSQPFLPWLDLNSYTPVPGGTFEAGAPAWTLSGNAAAVSGNETFNVNSATDSSSLALPDSSSATSPSMCVGIQNPTLRFFSRNTGSQLSTLRVDVLFEDARGNVHSAPIATVLGGSSWQPTVPYPIAVNLLPLLPGNETAVAFQFTPQGTGGNWQVDDIYVDPYRWGG
jgi:hypothetical protein